MDFLKKLSHFFFLFLIVGLGGYFAAFNLEYIVVTVPHVQDIRIRAAAMYIIIFLLGVTFTVLYFGFEALKHTFIVAIKNQKIRKLEKRIDELEKSRPHIVPTTSSSVKEQIKAQQPSTI